MAKSRKAFKPFQPESAKEPKAPSTFGITSMFGKNMGAPSVPGPTIPSPGQKKGGLRGYKK